MTLGELDAGKPPVQFDEGRSATVIGSGLSLRPLRLLYYGSRESALQTPGEIGLGSQRRRNLDGDL